MQNQRMNNKVSKVNIEKIKARKRKLRLAFTKMSLMAMLLIVSTYAWFTSQKDVTLSNLRGTVEVVENMEISLDAKNWSQKIDLSDAKTVFENAQYIKDLSVEGTAKALLPNLMLPVSGVGELGQTIMPLYGGTATGTSLNGIGKYAEENGAQEVDNGYFAFDIYIKNTSKDGEDDILQLNLNSAVQVLTQGVAKIVEGNELKTFTGKAASGLQNTVRVGLALYEGEVSSTSTQAEILNSTIDAEIKDIAIWEPNASDHVEYIVENNNKLIDGSNNTKIEFDESEQVSTYALTEESIGINIENVYDINSEGLGLQNTFKTEKTSASDYRISSSSGKPLNIKSIQTESGNPKDFKITSNTVSRLRVYVWLEGQDVDCINIASEGGGIELDLGLTKDDEVGEVLQEGELNLQTSYELVGSSQVKVTVRSTQDLECPSGWEYDTTAVAKKEIYQVASTENVRLASEPVVDKKVIHKTFTGDVAQSFEITSLSGIKDRLQFQIINVTSGTPCMVKTKYDKVENTTGSVKVTISSDKQITVLPDGWSYVDSVTKTEISKEYTENITENVTIKDANGNEITTEVKIENIVENTENENLTLASVTNENIGDYIDLGNDIVKTNATSDDWRIFYTDGSRVYAILSDYLPAEKVPASANLEKDPTTFPYAVWNGRDLLLNELLNETVWSTFTNGITGATATGSPTVEQLMQSYNAKNGTNLVYTNTPILDSETETFDLYVPHTDIVDVCLGYWLATPYTIEEVGIVEMWVMSCAQTSGLVGTGFSMGGFCARPLISIPSNTAVTKTGDVWKVTNTGSGSENSEETLLSKVLGNESDMYGAYTNYSIDIDNDLNDNDWRIFYADENGVFLIADDYVLNSKIPTESLGMIRKGNYSINWENTLGLTMNTHSKFFTMRNETYAFTSTFNTNNSSYQYAASLLDTSKWTSFVDSTYAIDAIGSPTVEMWMSSWNKLYPSITEVYYCNNGTSNGYYIGTTTNPTTGSVLKDTSELTGYNESTLYYPHKEMLEYNDGSENYRCVGYWLSSHLAGNIIPGNVMGIYYNARVGFVSNELGLRPIVALKPNIKATKVGDVWNLSN